MNLGTLVTIANNAPDNFVLLVIDNGVYGSTGEQPTYTNKKTSLADMAFAAGFENVYDCRGQDTYDILSDSLNSNSMTVIVSHVESGNEILPPISMHPIYIRDRFRLAF